MSDSPMGSAQDHAHPTEAVPADVVAILIRAGELGFSPTRVAIALGVSPHALASIEPASPPGRSPWTPASQAATRP